MSDPTGDAPQLTHFRDGQPRMVDVSAKVPSTRTARAEAWVLLPPESRAALLAGQMPKGDPLGVARLAGLAGSKRTADLIFLCHPIPVTGAEVEKRVARALEQVRLPASYAQRLPHELSGGQRQRVSIARALILEPSLLIADEPTSALDVTIQAHVIEVLREAIEEARFACVFISHDLAVVGSLADHVTVLRRGRAVEQGPVQQVLGSHKYSNELYAKGNPAGVAVGLAWTAVGGEILFIEASLSKGKGSLTLTGNLGNVMKESATTALSYLKAHAEEWNISSTAFDEQSIHIHVPEGAVPKDGPSAGITMLTALASAFTGRKAKPYMAMTGEITLRGLVLPVGGIKEKILAAKRAGIKDIVLSSQNEKDVLDIDAAYLKGLKFHYVSRMEEVLHVTLGKR